MVCSKLYKVNHGFKLSCSKAKSVIMLGLTTCTEIGNIVCRSSRVFILLKETVQKEEGQDLRNSNTALKASVMNVVEYLSSCHPDDLLYRLSIEFAVRNLEQQNELVSDINTNQLLSTSMSDEEFIRRFLILGNLQGIYFARQNEFTCTLVPDLCRIIQAGKGLMILKQILEISRSNHIQKKEPLLIALALCARYKVRDTQSKRKLPWDTIEEQEKLLPDAVCRDIRPVMENTYQQCLQKVALFSVHKVCVTPIDLFMFINYCKVISKESGLKKDSNGWGRALRATVIKWYYNQTPASLVVMVTKYRHRVNYSHRDLFCLSHIHPKRSFLSKYDYLQHQQEFQNIFEYVTRGSKKIRRQRRELLLKKQCEDCPMESEETEQVRQNLEKLSFKEIRRRKPFESFVEKAKSEEVAANRVVNTLKYIQAFEELRNLTPANIDRAVSLILQYGNFNYLSSVLSNITSFFHEDDENYTNFAKDDPVSLVVSKLADVEKLEQERFHPLTILLAKTNYEYGHEMRGNRIWEPVKSIQRALDSAFYSCFKAVKVTNKRYLIAVDISDSMDSFVQGTMLACSQAAATLSMMLIQNEASVIPLAFSDILVPLEWDRFMSLGEYLNAAKKLRYGTTDCAQPMRWAIENEMEVDVFIILTDNDVSVKSMKPCDAIQRYRHQMDLPNAKLIVVGMTDKIGSLANPDDPDMLVICGMSPSVPQIIYDFVLNFEMTD
uniref:TROVE domain-containing protein n=1 Tax=Setaria digitata TaxID=48799 RepID=A0A915PIU3_9BILA